MGKGSWTKCPGKKFPERVQNYKIVLEDPLWDVSRIIMEKDWGVSSTDY